MVQAQAFNLREIAESMIRESVIALVTGDRRTGKTTVAKVLALLASRLGSRINGRGRPWGVDPDGQLGRQFEEVSLDGRGPAGLPSWAPRGAYPYRYNGIWLLDEAQSAYSGVERECLRALIQRSGPHGLSGVMTSQRPADLAQACPPAARLVDWLIAGRCSFPADVEYLERVIGIDARPLASLPRHQFLIYRLGA